LNSEEAGAAATSNFGDVGEVGDPLFERGDPFFDPVGDVIHEGLPGSDDIGELGD
jgi:hypothetical protein